MKKLLFVICLMSSITMMAQNEDNPMTASLQVGPNGYMFLARLISDNATFFDADGNPSTGDAKAGPTFGLSFDYAVTNRFSLGASMGYNRFTLGADNVSITKADGFLSEPGAIDLSASRLNISIRPLFHYGNNEKLDMYSGVRLGVGIWSFNLDTDIQDVTADDIIGSTGFPSVGFAPALIPFGLRYYFTDNLGAGFETHLGAPYWGNIQVNYRFGGR
jgi:Outer membrane protein beta-barrel domain